jgi:Kdo2-lipid IVA lauroyltransferase/acyltransferase
MIKKGFSYIGIFFLHLLSLLPLPLLQILSSACYYPVYYIIQYRKKIVRKNLTRSFPTKDMTEIIKIEKRYYRYFIDLILEIVKMSSISKKEVLKRVKMNNFNQVEEYFRKGQSALACSGHYGNWELAMLAAGLYFSAKEYVIYKPINNRVFESWFNRLRTRYGNILLPMRQTLRQIVATKDQITLFCLASDQSPVREEVQYTLEFLHQPTAVLMGLEKLAKQTNRPVFYFDIKRVKRGYYEIDCAPMCTNPATAQLYEITQLFYEKLSQSIQRDPEYWLWSHNRWKLNN